MDIYLRGSLAYVRGENEDKNQPLSEISPLNGSVSIRWDNDSYFAEVTERFAAGQNRVDPDLKEQTTSGWAVTDIRTGANWEKWTLALGVNNIFDISYMTHLSYQRDPFSSGVKVPEVGAFAYTTLSYNF
jgi:iron complex outermembrane receptor protein